MDLFSLCVSIKNMLNTLLFPYQCLLCKGRSDKKRDLCSHCERSLVGFKSRCTQCGLWLEETEEALCGKCLRFPPAFDRAITALDYTKESAYLMQQFKFHHRFSEGKALANLLRQSLGQAYQNEPWPDLILPVPLHYKRLFSRGYNQALLIAQNLKLPLKIDYRLVKRLRHTPRQVKLSGKFRKRNLKGAFKVIKPVTGLHIALLDDVITTGSTLEAIAYELKKAGAKRVDVWAVLRTQK